MLITGGSSHCFYFVLFLANNLEVVIIFVYHEVTTVLDLAVELSSQKNCHSTELEASKKVEHLELQMHDRSALYFARSSEKWKHGVPCSKIISNFKMATAEHESKPRTLRIAGPCVTAQVGQSQTSSEVIISKPLILWVRKLKTRSGKHSLVPVPCDFMQ